MAKSEKTESVYSFAIILGVVLSLANAYYYSFPMFASRGYASDVTTAVLSFLGEAIFQNPYHTKLFSLLICTIALYVRRSKKTPVAWGVIITFLICGLVGYLMPWRTYGMYFWGTVAGFFILLVGIALLASKTKGYKPVENDVDETFEQCEEKVENKLSVNIPFEYQWKHKLHKGWINVVSPQRATLILGTPGSGKSYSVYKPFIWQMMAKGYCFALYDYKMPVLSEEVYNEYLRYRKNKNVFPIEPQFCVINFNDPRYSLRCNPIHPRYIENAADTAEIAEIIFKNVGGEGGGKNGDFFTMSARMYVDSLVLYLRNYKHGRYCTFPHLIELMAQDYKKVFKILMMDPKVKVKLVPFQSALTAKAMDQLMGQVASAQIPLNRFAAESLYWTLSGDDFSLDINDPQHPKIMCFGNDPDRQGIYGTVLALYTSRIFKIVNHPGKRPLSVLLDELPTVIIKDLDTLIATARSNNVAIVLGAQDKSQLRKNYGDKEANNIFNTVGNIFTGAVSGETAKDFSEMFGQEWRQQQSHTSSQDSESFSESSHQVNIMPRSKLETLSQGVFAGRIADKFGQEVKKKLFCGKIIIDPKEVAAREKKWQKIPIQTDFGYDELLADIKKDEEAAIMEYITDRITLKLLKQEKSHKDDIFDAMYAEDYALNAKGDIYSEDTVDDNVKLNALAATYYEKIVADKEIYDDILEKTIAYKFDKRVQETVEKNYFRIKKEIEDLVATEYALAESQEAEEKAKKEQEEAEKAAEALPAGRAEYSAKSKNRRYDNDGFPFNKN